MDEIHSVETKRGTVTTGDVIAIGALFGVDALAAVTDRVDLILALNPMGVFVYTTVGLVIRMRTRIQQVNTIDRTERVRRVRRR